jgi:hypothetical protein
MRKLGFLREKHEFPWREHEIPAGNTEFPRQKHEISARKTELPRQNAELLP